MATLTRPGVEISQEIITESPTVLTPSLVPCIVGPCFQIVTPITSAGLLDSGAQVTTAAMIVSTVVSDPASLSGLVMSVTAGGDATIVQFPVTINNVGISHALIATTINKKLDTVTAEFKNNKLVLKTNGKGNNASIKLSTVAQSAYAALGLTAFVDKDVKGTSSYTNLSYTVPYTSLPSPLADVSEIILEGDGIDIFRYFNNTLTQFSETSATNWNSYTAVASSSGTANPGGANTSLTINREDQPAYNLGRTKLFGKPVIGTKTNTVVNLGRSASITIPLSHDHDPFSTTNTWPDATGGNFLRVSAVGLEPYQENPSNQPGKYIGTAGHDVLVVITSNGGASTTAAWNTGTDTLTIDLDPAASTFDLLSTAISGLTGITNEITVELGFDPLDKSDKVLLAGAYPLGKTFRLARGVDPVNFAPTNVAVSSATITGAVHVAAADDGDDCEVTGKQLDISIDGSDFVKIQFTGGDAVLDQIDDALGALGSCTASASLRNELGETFEALKIASASADEHDSTIELRASDPLVIENLFGGYKTRTETIDIGAALTNQDRTLATGVVSGTNYNKRGHVLNEKAITRGSVTAVISNCLGIGSLVFDGNDVTAHQNTSVDLEIAHSTTGTSDTTGPTPITCVLSGAADLDELIADLDTAIGLSGLNNLVGVSKESVGGEDRLVLYDATGTAGGSVRVVADNTTPALITTLDGAGTTLFGATADFTVYATTAAEVTLTYKDSGTNGALQLTSVSNSFANTKVSDALALDMDTYTVETAAAHAFEHSTGTLKLDFAGDSNEAVVGLKKPVALAMTASSAVTFAYSRVHPCCTGPTPPLYTSRVFHGDSDKTLLGDLLYNDGSILGRVVAIENFVAGASTFTNAQLVLSEYAVTGKATVSDWYITAEALIPNDGRVVAEASYNDLEGSINVKHALIRDGAGIAHAGSSAPVYVQYKALRTDVTSSAVDPGLLIFNSASEVESLIGPINQDNPLAFGLSLAFLNAPSISLSAIGVDEISADAPDGTVDAYDRALNFLELKEVYSIAPLTQDREVHKLLNLHVQALSEPKAKKERMGIISLALPTEKESTLVLSGTATIGPEINGKFLLDFADDTLNIPVALNGKTDANGDTLVGGLGQDYTTQNGVYLDRSGDAFKYWISKVTGTSQFQIEINDAFLPGGGPGTGGNDDGYYKLDAAALADFPANGELITIFVRQTAIDTSTTAGKLSACETLAEIAGGVTGYQNRRLVLLQPENVGTTLDGTEILVDGHYLGAAVAAMIGQQNPSQPFTNLPMVGFTRPVGSSDKFSENQMATAAAGGVYWIIQDVAGGSLASRHQLTTDVTSLKTRELSILKAVDYLAKLIRGQVKRFIGRNNITKQLLETVALGISGALANATGSVVANASLDKIVQDTSSLDTIQVEISVTPFYPANTIKITIFV